MGDNYAFSSIAHYWWANHSNKCAVVGGSVQQYGVLPSCSGLHSALATFMGIFQKREMRKKKQKQKKQKKEGESAC